MQKKTNILGFDVSTQSVQEIVSFGLNSGDQKVINTFNPHSYVEQKSDVQFSKALYSSDILIPDGSGIVLAAKYINNHVIEKIAGYDLFIETMNQLNLKRGKVFFLGSHDFVLEKIIEKSRDEFPCVQVEGFSPSFKSEFNASDYTLFSQKINSFSPNVVFVGLTAPKQEKLIRHMKNYTNVNFLSGIGAVFDFYAGTVQRPSNIWISLHLEWFLRLLKEPKRLWKRNFVSTPVFLFDMLKAKTRKNPSM